MTQILDDIDYPGWIRALEEIENGHYGWVQASALNSSVAILKLIEKAGYSGLIEKLSLTAIEQLPQDKQWPYLALYTLHTISDQLTQTWSDGINKKENLFIGHLFCIALMELRYGEESSDYAIAKRYSSFSGLGKRQALRKVQEFRKKRRSLLQKTKEMMKRTGYC